MRTSAPDHLYLTTGHMPLASIQLFYTLIGHYRITRRSQNSAIIDSQLYPPHLLHPTTGSSTLTLRASTSPYYEIELLQTSTITHSTLSQTHPRTSHTIEKRCFRLRNSMWSVWSIMDDDGMGDEGDIKVGEKLADLRLWEVPRPVGTGTERGEAQIVHLGTVGGEQGGVGEGGTLFLIRFWLGRQPCWEMRWQQVGGEVVHDEFWPVMD